MDIIIGKKTPVNNAKSNAGAPIKPGRRTGSRDQRRNRQDRRKGVRDGIIVSISSIEDRRRSCGRRRSDYQIWT